MRFRETRGRQYGASLLSASDSIVNVADFRAKMDPQLHTLVAGHPLGKNVLIGHKLRQLIPGRGLRWCWPVSDFIVQHEDYSEFPQPVPFNYLGVGLGEREADDSLILLLQEKGLNVAPFISRPAPAPVPPPIQVPQAMAHTPGIGLQTPLPGFGTDPVEQTQAFQNAIMNIVAEGVAQ